MPKMVVRIELREVRGGKAQQWYVLNRMDVPFDDILEAATAFDAMKTGMTKEDATVPKKTKK